MSRGVHCLPTLGRTVELRAPGYRGLGNTRSSADAGRAEILGVTSRKVRVALAWAVASVEKALTIAVRPSGIDTVVRNDRTTTFGVCTAIVIPVGPAVAVAVSIDATSDTCCRRSSVADARSARAAARTSN